MTEKYWIQEAVKRKGSLRSYVKRKYGKRGFTKSPKTGKSVIKHKILSKLAKKKGVIGRKARLAITLKRLRR